MFPCPWRCEHRHRSVCGTQWPSQLTIAIHWNCGRVYCTNIASSASSKSSSNCIEHHLGASGNPNVYARGSGGAPPYHSCAN
eukprot:1742684-Ditylum_brightwellii.AAC.1